MENKTISHPYTLEQVEEIRKENEYYRSIIEDNSFYVIKIDAEGNYTYMNAYFAKIMAIDPVEYIGKDALSLIIPEDHEVCRETVRKCFENPEQSHWVMLRKPSKFGVIATQWEFRLLTDAGSQSEEVMCIGHDITPLIIKQEELQELIDVTAEQNKRLVNFTYIVSHNIRSHVANIVGIVNLNDTDNLEERGVAWDMIKSSSSGLDETLTNLNEIISIETNAKLPLSKLDVQVAVDKITESIPALIANADTNIAYRSDGDDCLNVNAAYFESILLNLFTNALKYRQEGRSLHIVIELKNTEKYKVLLFKDNGMGIDLSKYGGQLFKMYKTFHGNSDARGVGLFIVKSQIESMSGKIEVESEVGEGTTFKLYFLKDLK